MQISLAFAVCLAVVLVQQGAGDQSISMAMSDENNNDNSNSNDVLGGRNNNEDSMACDSNLPTISSSTPPAPTTIITTTTQPARNWTYTSFVGSSSDDLSVWNTTCNTTFAGSELGMPKTQAGTDAVSAYSASAYPNNVDLVYWIGLTCTATTCTWFDGTTLNASSYNLWPGGLAGARADAAAGKTHIQLTSHDSRATWQWASAAYFNQNAILCQY